MALEAIGHQDKPKEVRRPWSYCERTPITCSCRTPMICSTPLQRLRRTPVPKTTSARFIYARLGELVFAGFTHFCPKSFQLNQSIRVVRIDDHAIRPF